MLVRRPGFWKFSFSGPNLLPDGPPVRPGVTVSPVLLQGKVHFTQLMTSKLIDDVKLVGPTISCGGTIRDGEVRQNPHVQSYAMATDSVGLEVLMNDGAVFACYEDFANTIWYSELGSAAVMLEAGYNLDSFQVRLEPSQRALSPAVE